MHAGIIDVRIQALHVRVKNDNGWLKNVFLWGGGIYLHVLFVDGQK